MITAPSSTGRYRVPSVFSNFNLKGTEEGFLQVTARLKCSGCVGISQVDMGEEEYIIMRTDIYVETGRPEHMMHGPWDSGRQLNLLQFDWNTQSQAMSYELEVIHTRSDKSGLKVRNIH